MSQLSRGRPTISDSELTPEIKIALANRVKGKSWKECAKVSGIAYSTLRAWMRDNKAARNYLREKVEDHLDQSYFYLAQSAPKVADEMLKMILNPKVKPYVKAPLFESYFRIVDKGFTDKNFREEMDEFRERMYQVEGKNIIDLYQKPDEPIY